MYFSPALLLCEESVEKPEASASAASKRLLNCAKLHEVLAPAACVVVDCDISRTSDQPKSF